MSETYLYDDDLYDDDEPGSPWSFFLYVDARGDEDQRAGLVGILSGARGGTARTHFPWAWKPSRFLGWRAVEIAIDHTPGRGWFRAGGDVEALVKQRLSRIPMGFAGDGRDTAAAVLFLASEEARFVTGTELVVDGGMSVRCG